MPLDLSALLNAGNEAPLIRPREIFAALPHKPWPYLRHEQGEILEGWFSRRQDKDVVIKQNTGGGKTAAGLLIAQSSLNEGIGPAVYLTPDNYLAAQVRAEAARMALTVADDPSDLRFRASNAILVTTFQTMVNAMSRFGVVGDSRPEHISVGTVIVDDAHAALATAEGQFRLSIPATHDAYHALAQLFENDCRDQAPKAWADVQANDYSSFVRVPFWAWMDKQTQVMEALHPHARDDELKFEWSLIANVLPLCAATITSRSIEVKPPCLPISMIPAFAHAQRRIYLTATLADDSVLVTDLNADPSLVKRPVTPGSAADLGDRMILATKAIAPTLDDDAIRNMARQYAHGDRDGDDVTDSEPINVVVLVPSAAAAAKWAPYRDDLHDKHTIEGGVAALKARHVGLVVLVARYDGVDLPDGACRLLILDGFPRPMDATERREATVTTGSRLLLGRQIQRVEQGMGRGVRDSEDYCAVLLLGSDLAVATHDPSQLQLFSPATRAQLALSRKITEQIQGEGLNSLKQALALCLDQATDWVALRSRELANVTYDQNGTVRPDAIAARTAFDLAATGRFGDASAALQPAVTATEDLRIRGLILEQQAAYLHPVDPAAAQAKLARALEVNEFVLRPAAGIAPGPLRATRIQARAACEFLRSTYQTATTLVLGVRAMLDGLVWGDEDRSDDAEATWQLLGSHLGLTSSRPDHEFGAGPDNLWVLSDDRHAVIELKTGCQPNPIVKKDVNQLGGSVAWDAANYQGVQAVAIMVHPSSIVERRGTPVRDMRVVTPEKWELLRDAVIGFAVALADGTGRWHDEGAVAEHLTARRLMAGTFFQTFAVPARAENGSR